MRCFEDSSINEDNKSGKMVISNIAEFGIFRDTTTTSINQKIIIRIFAIAIFCSILRAILEPNWISRKITHPINPINNTAAKIV